MTNATSSKWGGVEGREHLRALAASLTQTAKNLLATSDDLVPLVAVCRKDGEVALVPMHWAEGHKREIYKLVEHHAKKELGMEAAILVNDSWIANVPKDTNLATLGAVHDLPQRVDALVVMVLGPDWRESVSYPYERHAGSIVWHDETRTETFENELFSL